MPADATSQGIRFLLSFDNKEALAAVRQMHQGMRGLSDLMTQTMNLQKKAFQSQQKDLLNLYKLLDSAGVFSPAGLGPEAARKKREFLETLNANTRAMEKAFEQSEAAAKKYNTELGKTATSLEGLGKGAEKFTGSLDEMGDSLDRVKRFALSFTEAFSFERLVDQAIKLSGSLDKMAYRYENVASKTSQFRSEMEEAQKSTKAMADQIIPVIKRLNDLGIASAEVRKSIMEDALKMERLHGISATTTTQTIGTMVNRGILGNDSRSVKQMGSVLQATMDSEKYGTGDAKTTMEIITNQQSKLAQMRQRAYERGDRGEALRVGDVTRAGNLAATTRLMNQRGLGGLTGVITDLGAMGENEINKKYMGLKAQLGNFGDVDKAIKEVQSSKGDTTQLVGLFEKMLGTMSKNGFQNLPPEALSRMFGGANITKEQLMQMAVSGQGITNKVAESAKGIKSATEGTSFLDKAFDKAVLENLTLVIGNIKSDFEQISTNLSKTIGPGLVKVLNWVEKIASTVAKWTEAIGNNETIVKSITKAIEFLGAAAAWKIIPVVFTGILKAGKDFSSTISGLLSPLTGVYNMLAKIEAKLTGVGRAAGPFTAAVEEAAGAGGGGGGGIPGGGGGRRGSRPRSLSAAEMAQRARVAAGGVSAAGVEAAGERFTQMAKSYRRDGLSISESLMEAADFVEGGVHAATGERLGKANIFGRLGTRLADYGSRMAGKRALDVGSHGLSGLKGGFSSMAGKTLARAGLGIAEGTANLGSKLMAGLKGNALTAVTMEGFNLMGTYDERSNEYYNKARDQALKAGLSEEKAKEIASKVSDSTSKLGVKDFARAGVKGLSTALGAGVGSFLGPLGTVAGGMAGNALGDGINKLLGLTEDQTKKMEEIGDKTRKEIEKASGKQEKAANEMAKRNRELSDMKVGEDGLDRSQRRALKLADKMKDPKIAEETRQRIYKQKSVDDETAKILREVEKKFGKIERGTSASYMDEKGRGTYIPVENVNRYLDRKYANKDNPLFSEDIKKRQAQQQAQMLSQVDVTTEMGKPVRAQQDKDGRHRSWDASSGDPVPAWVKNAERKKKQRELHDKAEADRILHGQSSGGYSYNAAMGRLTPEQQAIVNRPIPGFDDDAPTGMPANASTPGHALGGLIRGGTKIVGEGGFPEAVSAMAGGGFKVTPLGQNIQKSLMGKLLTSVASMGGMGALASAGSGLMSTLSSEKTAQNTVENTKKIAEATKKTDDLNETMKDLIETLKNGLGGLFKGRKGGKGKGGGGGGGFGGGGGGGGESQDFDASLKSAGYKTPQVGVGASSNSSFTNDVNKKPQVGVGASSPASPSPSSNPSSPSLGGAAPTNAPAPMGGGKFGGGGAGGSFDSPPSLQAAPASQQGVGNYKLKVKQGDEGRSLGERFVFNHEIASWSGRLHMPGGKSGVTLGPGYDMKLRKPGEIVKDLTAIGVDRETASKISAGAGLTEEKAKNFARANKGLVNLDRKQQWALFDQIKHQYSDPVDASLKVKVSDNMRSALIALAYNSPRAAQQVIKKLNKNDMEGAFATWRKWGKSGNVSLASRREDEIKLATTPDAEKKNPSAKSDDLVKSAEQKTVKPTGKQEDLLLNVNAGANSSSQNATLDKAMVDQSVKKMKHGGIANQRTLAVIGEAGPEAVVPLRHMGDLGNAVSSLNSAVASPSDKGASLVKSLSSEGDVDLDSKRDLFNGSMASGGSSSSPEMAKVASLLQDVMSGKSSLNTNNQPIVQAVESMKNTIASTVSGLRGDIGGGDARRSFYLKRIASGA